MFDQCSAEGKKQSVISWETTLAAVSNAINNLPVARCEGSTAATRDELDVLTRNRILLGRNNMRSPGLAVSVSGQNPMKLLSKLQEINTKFYETLMKNISEFIATPKWFSSEQCCRVGDVVLFLASEGAMTEQWHLAIVCKKISVEGNPAQFQLKYRNAGEKTFRKTDRSARELTVIHSVHDLDFNTTEHWWEFKTSAQFAVHCHTPLQN